MVSDKTKSVLGLLIIVGLFVLFSYLARENIEFLKAFIGGGYYGIIFYILITIFAVVVAPISMMPLIPVLSNLYGWFYAAIITLFAWTLGSFIVFFLSRKYGVDLIKKIVSLKAINKIESKIPDENLFLDILLLRMILPVDILSYALGIFSKVEFKIYASATFLGMIPFAFIFSYLGTLPLWYQLSGILIVSFLIGLVHLLRNKN